jgi:hypothetical protein
MTMSNASAEVSVVLAMMAEEVMRQMVDLLDHGPGPSEIAYHQLTGQVILMGELRHRLEVAGLCDRVEADNE